MKSAMSERARPSTVLLVSSDSSLASKVEAALAGDRAFEFEWVHRFSEALARLRQGVFAAILLELSLPDVEGIDIFGKLSAAAPNVPVLVLGGSADEGRADQIRASGTRDYLPADHLNAYTLTHGLKNAIERCSAEEALFLEKERASVTLDSIGDAVLCTDLAGKVTYLNLVAETMTGWLRTEASGQPLAEVFRIIDGATRESARDPMKMAVEQNRTVGLTANCILIRRDGSEFAIEDSAAPIHDRAGHIVGAVIVFHDVTKARAIAREMTHSAQHDPLTNLPNRVLLNDRIAQSIALARRQNRALAVIFLDLDRFKFVNDSLGHAAGDELLLSVSKRLQSGLRGCDTVSRQGGDEFVILLSGVTSREDAATSARKILGLLKAPHPVAGQNLHIDCSLGISLYPADGNDGETLIKNADTAMYYAKERGRNHFHFYVAAMNAKSVERQTLESGLRDALEREEFFLNYQSKVSLESGELTGVEALLRWKHPTLGLVPPCQFVPIAEDSGLIVSIGRWVLRAACMQARSWQQAGRPGLPIAVNVSALELRDPAFVESVRAILLQTGLQAQLLEMEITEGLLVEDSGSTSAVFRELKEMGISLAIDDFGTGHSSLSYLRQFPISILKIDRSFVGQITADTEDSKIISAVIGMAKSLGYVVVAEGVETSAQKTYLQAQGCAQAQGYLFSRPLSASGFARLLQTSVTDSVVH
jgi:diguanylate cyclase (GGDEF)-like protein/PAS domain S-box-containing protein